MWNLKKPGLLIHVNADNEQTKGFAPQASDGGKAFFTHFSVV